MYFIILYLLYCIAWYIYAHTLKLWNMIKIILSTSAGNSATCKLRNMMISLWSTHGILFICRNHCHLQQRRQQHRSLYWAQFSALYMNDLVYFSYQGSEISTVLVFSFPRWGNWGTERWSSSPAVSGGGRYLLGLTFLVLWPRICTAHKPNWDWGFCFLCYGE